MKIAGISQKPDFLLQESGATQFQRALLPGFYSGIWVFFYGTNNSSQAVAHSDFTLQVEHEGRQIINIKGDKLLEINNDTGGYVSSTSTTSGAFALANFIPFSIGDVQNSLYVRPGGNTTVTWIPGSSYATKVSSGTVELYPIKGDAAQTYVPHILPYDLAAFSGTYRNDLPFRNVKELYIKGANLTQIQIQRDNKLEFNGNYAAMLSLTSYLSALEAAAATFVHVNFGERFTDYLAKSVNIQLANSSSAAVEIQVVSFEFSDGQTASSLAMQEREVSDRVAQIPDASKALPILRKTAQRVAVAE